VADRLLAWLVAAAGAAVVGLVAGALTGVVVSIVTAPFRKAKTGSPKGGAAR